MRNRIAPTPSGYLHIGNLYNAVLAYVWASVNHGKLLLRIDDIDHARFRPEYLKDIFETLHFFEINWQYGPKNETDFTNHFSQLHRLNLYQNAINILLEKNILYACTCTRKQFSENEHSNICPNNCHQKNIPLTTTNAAWRIKLPENTIIHFQDIYLKKVEINLNTQMPNFVVRQKNGMPSYQICSLVDDVHFGITHISRGQDLLPSTAAQIHLANLLGYKNFNNNIFFHHPLIINNIGEKLSKSKNDTCIKTLRSKGFSQMDILKILMPHFNIHHFYPKNIAELINFLSQKPIDFFQNL